MDAIKCNNFNFAIKDWLVISIPEGVFYTALIMIFILSICSIFFRFKAKRVMNEIKLKSIAANHEIETRRANLRLANFCAPCDTFMAVEKQNHTWLFHKCPKCKQKKVVNVNAM